MGVNCKIPRVHSGPCTDQDDLVPKKKRHPSSQRFHDTLKELGDLHDKKQADYGTDEDPFNNIRASAKDWGIPAWVGAMLRATDKVRRLQRFHDVGKLANESVIDAFNDLAVYAVIARVMYEEEESPSYPLTEEGIEATLAYHRKLRGE